MCSEITKMISVIFYTGVDGLQNVFAQTPATLTEVLNGFLQSLPVNSRIVP
jgi:hypothetical protein